MRMAWLVGGIASIAAGPSPAQPAKTAITARIRDYIEQCHAVAVCNGAYIVARDGKPVFRGAVGDAGDDARSPLTPDHAFDIGSVSKQFTAMAVLTLAAEGKVSLAAPVVTYLPDLPYRDVTVEQLLNHTSGIPDMLDSYGAMLRGGKQSAPLTGREVVAMLAAKDLPLRARPGSVFAYNNTAYMVAASLVEAVAREPFDAYLQRRFFGPLGMTHTRVRTPANEASIGPRAWGFRPAADGTRRPNEQLPGFYVRGAGGIYSTVSDLLIWENALPTGRVVPIAWWRRATTPLLLPDGRTYPYGYGLKLKPASNGARRYNHDGDWRGFKANLASYPDSRVTIVQLTNNSEDDSADVNEEALAQLAIGGDAAPVKAPIGRDLYARLDDPAAARRWFMAQRTAQPQGYDIREDELNALGYRLLDKKQVDAAVTVFGLAANAFPTSANAFDSLAEAQEAKGDIAGARATMRRAVAIAPGSKQVADHAARLQAMPLPDAK